MKEVIPASSITPAQIALLRALIDQAQDFGGFPEQGYICKHFPGQP